MSDDRYGDGAPSLPRRGVLSGLGFSGLGLSGLGLSTVGAPMAVAEGRQTEARTYAFSQVDVFSPERFGGNPLAVVIGADDLSEDDLKRFSIWTNLSETTFLLKPTHPQADYRVRIFSLGDELPFAGHPTLGTCHVWLRAGGAPKGAHIIQECALGLVRLLRADGRLAFEAPPLRRAPPLDAESLAHIRRALGLGEDEITASALLDAGLKQPAIMIRSRERLLALKVNWAAMNLKVLGVIAPWPSPARPGDPLFEVRWFDSTLPAGEDPVTGSFNASAARWMIGAGMAPDRYVVSQGTALGRVGRVHVDKDGDSIWIGGDATDHILGQLQL